jgi:3'(2'), 5'-bisphosphate nucleotidase
VTDEELAAFLADGAGNLLMELREGRDPPPGSVADNAANAFILAGLARWRPDDAVLSEESPDDLSRLVRPRCWIVDPLDGTREYEEGRNDWAVHVGLAISGHPAVGAVALPALGEVHRSDDRPVARPGRTRPIIVVSRSRPPRLGSLLAAALDAEVVEMGSAGAKAMAVVGGAADLYVHAGGQHAWDNCAPVAVALGAGLHASQLDGRPFVYNQADSFVPDLVIGVPALAERALALIRETG